MEWDPAGGVVSTGSPLQRQVHKDEASSISSNNAVRCRWIDQQPHVFCAINVVGCAKMAQAGVGWIIPTAKSILRFIYTIQACTS